MAITGTDRQSCAVCGRGILNGERTYDYATPAGEVRDVCALCRPSAERVGWMPPAKLESVSQARHERRHGWLSGLLARRPVAAKPHTRLAGGDQDAGRARGPAPAAAEQVADPPTEPPKRSRIDAALATFNAGATPKLIAGLNRSLGEPRAEVRDGGGKVAVQITVAWELSWYTWEVSGGAVEEVAKGADVAEREGPEPDWNASIEQDGRVTMAAGA